jgi:hypothetical protein
MTWWVKGRISWIVVGLVAYVTLVILLTDLAWRLTTLHASTVGAAVFLSIAAGCIAAVFLVRRKT